LTTGRGFYKKREVHKQRKHKGGEAEKAQLKGDGDSANFYQGGKTMKKCALLLKLSIICMSMVVIAGSVLTSSDAADTKSGEKEPVFAVLNPQGIDIERPVKGISPRLDTLKGKTVNVINLHGANEKVMENIAKDLKAAVPECNVVYYRTEGGWGGSPLTKEDWEKILKCDAAIVGHNF
jgi:hypothetical protein